MRDALQRDYEALNMRILFSKTATPTSETYAVTEGDSLYKIARQFGTTVDLIKRSNGLKNDTIYVGMKLKIEKGKFSIRVDKSENDLILFLEDRRIKRYRVATGANNGTPVGEFKIVNKLVNPTWYHAGAIVPPDSEKNILGTRWMGFDEPGYGIHGTTMPESIGKQASLGCIRMLNEDVEELYAIIPQGAQVKVID
jgi:lipoprotein-anchoring transpeptidase ErfK/SrfK